MPPFWGNSFKSVICTYIVMQNLLNNNIKSGNIIILPQGIE